MDIKFSSVIVKRVAENKGKTTNYVTIGDREAVTEVEVNCADVRVKEGHEGAIELVGAEINYRFKNIKCASIVPISSSKK